MELIESLFLFGALVIISYNYAKRKRLTQEAHLQNLQTNNKNQLGKLEEELSRRASIINRVEEFIQGSKFIEPIATWRGEKIYRYIFKDGYLYEFEDTFPENNQRVGIDDEYLCFKQICYKRVINPIEFMNKFGNQLGIQQ